MRSPEKIANISSCIKIVALDKTWPKVLLRYSKAQKWPYSAPRSPHSDQSKRRGAPHCALLSEIKVLSWKSKQYNLFKTKIMDLSMRRKNPFYKQQILPPKRQFPIRKEYCVVGWGNSIVVYRNYWCVMGIASIFVLLARKYLENP